MPSPRRRRWLDWWNIHSVWLAILTLITVPSLVFLLIQPVSVVTSPPTYDIEKVGLKYSDWISLLSVLAAGVAAFYAFLMVRRVTTQLEESSGSNLTVLSNENNWRLLENFRHLPHSYQLWKGLKQREFAWRVIHLNHLNLLKDVFYGAQKKLIDQDEYESWIAKGTYWFSDFGKADMGAEILVGHEILVQLLKPEEGYPDALRYWLVSKGIINEDMVDDYQMLSKQFKNASLIRWDRL